MTEPTTSAAAGGFALYKLAIALGLPAGLVAIVVMLWVQPKSPQEWAMALICTVVSSLCGGSALVLHFELQHLASTGFFGLLTLAGIIFASGLPGWVIVRAGFAWADKRRNLPLDELVREGKQAVREAMK